MSLPPSYKRSPLSFDSPRTSPFRRPESPAAQLRRIESPSSPSPVPSLGSRPAAAISSPTRPQASPLTSPSKLQNADSPKSESESWTPRGLTPSFTTKRDVPVSPTRSSSTVSAFASNLTPLSNQSYGDNDALSKLPVHQIRQMREGFQILDRDNDGLVNREDVVDMLTNLGQPSSASDVTSFFPPGAPQTLPLASFLNTLSNLIAPLSSQKELLNAFAAFDEKDDGEVDVKELKDALFNTSPEPGERVLSSKDVDFVLGGFTGRKAFGKDAAKVGGRAEVFNYRNWAGGIMGGGEEEKEQK